MKTQPATEIRFSRSARHPIRSGVEPLSGNESIARGAWQAGVKLAAAYPGTPSTEILESLSEYPEEDLVAQWATNEKVALDVAIGGSFAGVRSIAAMKHVGLNVASDSLMSQTYIGVNAGLVLVVCDDPGIHSSQNEQDTRIYGRLAMTPVLEPADAQEALDYTRLAFEISEQFDTPVILRSTTRLSHTRSPVRLGSRESAPAKGFQDNPVKNVMIPAHARQRHPHLLERTRMFSEYLESSDLIHWERSDPAVGVITAGTAYTYVKEVLPEASVLKLGVTWPLPLRTIREFCSSVRRVFVVEELEPLIEQEIRALGIQIEGKTWFPRTGEFSVEVLRECFHRAGVLDTPPPGPLDTGDPLTRPPLLCSGCPHTGAYMALRATDARVAGDIGCYTLAAIEPLKAIDTCVAMGSSIGVATGMAKAGVEKKPVVATIGDSTFLHSGIAPLIDAVYNKANITVIILDNHTVAMTGGQDHPGTGRTLRGDQTHRVDFEQLVNALGVPWVRKIDSYDLGKVYQTFREAMEYKGVSVVIADRPCVLDPVRIKGTPFAVDAEKCIACQSCMNLGCPSILWSDEWHEGRHKVKIDVSTCIGCSLCAQICPTDCIELTKSASPAHGNA